MNRTLILLTTLVLIVLSATTPAIGRTDASAAAAAVTPAAGAEPTTVRLNEVLEGGLERGLTGLVLTLEQGGDVVSEGAVGLASIALATALQPTDRFRIYSIARTFTAVVVLQLVREGIVSLDDTVADWIDGPVVARIPHVERITLRQLLNHTSGVYDYFDEDSPYWQDA